MKKLQLIVGTITLVSAGYIGATINLDHHKPVVESYVESGKSSSGLAFAQSLDRGFADLVKKVGPGVVNISTYARAKDQGNRMYGQGGPGGPNGMNNEEFRRFFEEFFGGRIGPGPRGMPRGQPDDEQDEGSEDGAPSPRQGPAGKVMPLALGSGFLIDAAEGLILTNFHVIQGADEVKVQFNEEETDLIPAEIVGRDPELDVALLKIKSKTKLTAIPLGDSDKIDVGEYVIAIGNPFSYGHSVSHGILSAKGRRNPEFKLGRYLQTDASINPGNSGGPLVNMKGEVIGINNAIDARAHGIGFAIPINMVKSVIAQLKSKGKVSRGYLGVSATDLNPEIAEQLKIDPKLRGVIISDVARGQAADKAGLKPYDVITSVNGEKITNAQDLTAKVTSVPIGQPLEIKYYRNGKEKTAKTTVGERPVAGVTPSPGGPGRGSLPDQRVLTVDDFGFRAQEVTTQTANAMGIPLDMPKAVVVVDLAYGSPAANAGLNRGDVILDVGGKEVKAITELEKALKSIKGKSVVLRVKRFDQQGNSFVSVVVLTK